MPKVRLVSRQPREAPISQQGYHQPLSGGLYEARPKDPYLYQMFFDTDLGMPIWAVGDTWFDASGSPQGSIGEGEGEGE